VESAIREGYLRYFDTAFWLRDARMMRERRQLLESPGVTFTDTLLEPLLPYEARIPLVQALARCGRVPQLAVPLAKMVFDAAPDFKLREHQAQALEVSLAPSTSVKRNVIVTSGTGSGKTECFLLPVLARLLEEKNEWPSAPALHRWWDSEE